MIEVPASGGTGGIAGLGGMGGMGGAGGTGGTAGGAGGTGGIGGTAGDGGSSTSDTSSTSSGGSAGDSSNGGAGGSTSSGGAGGSSTGGSATTSTETTTGAGGDPNPGPQDIGLVAVSARVVGGDDQRVLSVLAEDGTELDRETDLPVAALAYDGAEDRDVWFVFLAEDFPIDPTRPADLEVRRFNDRNNSWETLSELSALPPPRADQLVVLNGRLAYLSYNTSDGAETVTILDTRDLTDVQELDVPDALLETGQSMSGILGARGSATNANGDGGTVNLMLSTCENDTCILEIQPLFVGNNGINPGNLEEVGEYLGVPAFTSALEERRGFIAMHSTAEDRVLLVEFDPFDPANIDSTQLPSSSQTLGGMLLLECENVVGLSETTEQRMRNVSLQGGLSATKNLMRDAQRLYFEPFSQKAIAPFNADPSNPTPTVPNSGDPATAAIDAFIITGNGVSAPSVELLSTPDWVPPTDLAPLTAAMRTPIVFACE